MIVKGLSELSNNEVVLCLGGFDSLHFGHRSVIDRAKLYKEKYHCHLAVTLFSFNQDLPIGKHGGEVFTLDERLSLLDGLSVDEVISIDFTPQFAKLSAKDFLDKLSDNRLIARVLCGKDFKFGFNAQGDIAFLQDYFAFKNIEVEVVPFEMDSNGDKISTSSVKRCLSEGDVLKCKEEFGVYYFIFGIVEQGRREGRKLGFPTANVIPSASKYPLRSGVYACTVFVNGKSYRAITNLGEAPTFGYEKRVLECHIDGFSGELYGERIAVYFDERIRDIIKFDSIEELKKQLKKDLQVIR